MKSSEIKLPTPGCAHRTMDPRIAQRFSSYQRVVARPGTNRLHRSLGTWQNQLRCQTRRAGFAVSRLGTRHPLLQCVGNQLRKPTRRVLLHDELAIFAY